MRNCLLVLLVAGSPVAGAGCTASEPSIDARNLEAARTRFASRSQPSYAFTWRILSCFCSSDSLRPTRITVTNGAITRAVFVDDQRPVAEPERGLLRTIDGVFALIEQAIADGADELQVTYDDQYGFPAMLSIDPARTTSDDELSLQLSNFEPGAGLR